MEHKPSDISGLVNRTVRIAVVRGEDTVYYQGQLERKLFKGWYIINNPLVIYPDGTRKQRGGFKTFRERDLNGNVEVVNEPVRNVY